MKVLIKTPASQFSGYGYDGIGLLEAFLRLGLDVSWQPGPIDPPLPEHLLHLLTKPLEGPYDLTLQHAPASDLLLSKAARRATGLSVAWSMWESTSMDNMVPEVETKLEKSLEGFDLFLAYDSVSKQAFDPYVSKSALLPGGYNPDHLSYQERDWSPSSPFRFAMLGALTGRKNPLLSWQAFKNLKDNYPKDFDKAELHFKTNTAGFPPQMENWCKDFHIHRGTWPREDVYAFYKSSHVLLAPSRGEGKNLPALEMLSTGGSVIATNWGGHTSWLSDQYAYKLNYDLSSLKGFPDCQQASASLSHLEELMMHCYKNRSEVQRKGEVAARVIPAMSSWDAAVERLFHLLSEEFPSSANKFASALFKARQDQEESK
jgi:glycosyltransferase involved in cell wall biosynthesis